MEDNSKGKLPSVNAMQKTTFTASGICCSSEANLICKLLDPVEGIEKISVNILAKTATVIHDPSLAPASQIVKILNKAKLKASIRELGQVKTRKQSWPSRNVIASGVLMVVSMFSCVYHPLIWVALASIAVGIPNLLQRSVAALSRCLLDINVLMVVAVFGAVALRDYLEAASIVFLFTFAQWLEEISSDKARASLESLLNLAPRTAVVAETGERVDVKDVRLNTVVSAKAGEFIPVDGVVVEGSSSVDERSLTGEFMPVDKEISSRVWAGTIVLTGFINVLTTALEGDSAIARMVKLVEDAQNQRSRMEDFIEQFAKYYTPGVILTAAAVAVVPWVSGVQDFRQWIYVSLVLLVIACPCALVISTPVAKVCSLSAAAKMGLIVKGGSHMEVLAKIKAMAFDKTGTLTEGAFAVLDVQCVSAEADTNQMLHYISSLENLSSHPMANALVEYGRLHAIEPTTQVRDFKVIPGEGISGFVQDTFVQIGNARLALRNGWLNQFPINQPAGTTVGYVGIDDQFIGYFCLGDQIRKEAVEAVEELQKQGIHVVILTGDSKAAAEVIQKQIGTKIQIEASLSPEEKMNKVAELKERWGLTAMVGDGINDAPALALADIGIAMGVAGSAVATESANVALMSNDLRKIAEAVKLAKSSLRKIYQNVALSLAVKLLFFWLTFTGVPSLWAAVVADMGTSMLVIFNSMILLRSHGRPKDAAGIEKHCRKLEVSGPGWESEKTQFQRKLEESRVPLLALERGDDGASAAAVQSCCGKGCCGKPEVKEGGLSDEDCIV